MSKLFEVLSKDNLIDLQDISESIDFQEICSGSIEIGEASIGQIGQMDDLPRAASRTDLAPAVSPPVSALAPIFPFFDQAHSVAAEQYRIVRTKILHSANRPRLIVVSSPCKGDGKTITSINVAASLSLKEDTSVLLVDADLRRPMIAELLGIPSVPGLADILSGRVNLSSAAVRAREFPNLCILPAGDAGENPAELLHSERWSALIEQFRTQFSVVVMDTTPVAMVADYELVQHVSDGVILVVAPGRSDRKAYQNALQSVPKEKFIGVVLNRVPSWWLWKSPDYAYYGKQSRKGEAAAGKDR
jgi:protein-tyrosine kinase